MPEWRGLRRIVRLRPTSQVQDGVDLRDVQMEGAVPDGHLGALRAHAVARGRHRQLRRAAHLAHRSILRPAKHLPVR